MVKLTPARISMAIALLMAGCATQPTTAPTAASNDPLGLGDAVAPRYQTLSANAMPVAITNVAASSTGTELDNFTAAASSVRDPRWFAVSNVTDDNLHSAWGPAANDMHPTLTLNLAGATQLTGLGIKMDAGATFDVAVSNGGAFTTIATNVSPQANALDFVNLPSSTASQVRLTFHVKQNAQLLVCEAQLFTGGAVGSPSPSPSGTPPCLEVVGTTNLPGVALEFVGVAEAGGRSSGQLNFGFTGGDTTFTENVNSVTVSGDIITVDGPVQAAGPSGIFADGSAEAKLKITSRTATTFVTTLLSLVTKDAAGHITHNFSGAASNENLFGSLTICEVPSPSPSMTPSPSPCITFTGHGQVIQNSSPGTLKDGAIIDVAAATPLTGPSGVATIDFINGGGGVPVPGSDQFQVTGITDVAGKLTLTGSRAAGTETFKITAHDTSAGAVVDSVLVQTTNASGGIVTLINVTQANFSTVTLAEGTCQNPVTFPR